MKMGRRGDDDDDKDARRHRQTMAKMPPLPAAHASRKTLAATGLLAIKSLLCKWRRCSFSLHPTDALTPGDEAQN